MMGGLRYSDKKRICFMIKKGDSLTFYEQLTKLNKSVKEEWIAQGNRAEDFEEKGPKILMVLDNASFHKKSEVLTDIENNLPNIILEFLPPYSPDYNLIELVWHSAKEYIAQRTFENKEELAKVVNNLLNEGGLTINWIGRFDTSLRTLDALHLACASSNNIPLVTADDALARSAEALGVKVQLLRPNTAN